MFEIRKLNPISNRIYEAFGGDYHVTDDCPSPDAILVRSFNMTDFPIGENLLAIARAGAGVNNIPVPEMTEKGIVVFNTPGANANAVKELTICAMLLAGRDIYGGLQWAGSLAGTGNEVPKTVEKGKGKFGGTEIFGKTLGVLGLGAIGVKVANAAVQLGMNVFGYDPYLSPAHKEELLPAVELKSFEEIISSSDFLSLHIPLLDSTKEMINAPLIAKLKKGVILINMSRAELVNLTDVKQGIADGILRKYVVDFPTEDALNTPGILAIPHLGASTEEAEENCAYMAAAQLKSFLEQGNIVNSVNFPNLSAARTAKYRLAVAYNAGGGTLDVLKEKLKGIPHTFHYAERKSVGYAIIDTDYPICDADETEGLAEQIADSDGIISIRYL